jgi:hypothetical protein
VPVAQALPTLDVPASSKFSRLTKFKSKTRVLPKGGPPRGGESGGAQTTAVMVRI